MPVLAALDTIRDRGIALLIEAHAGHVKSQGNTRDLRPRGSSALLGWPEFGYGMRATGPSSAILVPWRGDRDLRDFPLALMKSSHGLWEEEKAVTLQQIYKDREQQTWNEYGWDDE
jgi:replicative DNA helicase